MFSVSLEINENITIFLKKAKHKVFIHTQSQLINSQAMHTQ